jgi:uncharacterized protein DUF3606
MPLPRLSIYKLQITKLQMPQSRRKSSTKDSSALPQAAACQITGHPLPPPWFQPNRGGKMSDDLKNVGSPDRKLISLEEEHEVRYWTTALGVTEQRLRELVAKHGHSAEKIRQALGKAA